MASITKIKTKEEIDQLYSKYKPLSLKETKPNYTYWQLKMNEFNVTAYQSGKVLYQGKDLDWLKEPEAEENNSRLSASFPMAGSDEVGTGDYFGPVVVAAVIVNSKQTAQKLHDLKIQDSKAMNDEAILKIAPKIKELCPYSICVLSNVKYNKVHERKNMNEIKAFLHNQVYLNLLAKENELPKTIIIDQFVQEKTYYKHLKKDRGIQIIEGIHFETKAENKYIAVAAASVLARASFLEHWKKMEDHYNMEFPKGAGRQVDIAAANFIQKFGEGALLKAAKVHFANTDKAKKYIG